MQVWQRHDDDPPTPEEVLAAAEAVENASAEWKAVVVAFDARLPALADHVEQLAGSERAGSSARRIREIPAADTGGCTATQVAAGLHRGSGIAPAHARESVNGGPGRTQRICAINARVSV